MTEANPRKSTFVLQTIDLSMRLWEINPTNSVVIPQSLVMRSIVLSLILISKNWSILKKVQEIKGS